MKLSLATIAVSSLLHSASAFHIQGPSKSTSLVLNASKAAKKKVSRAKWLEARGYSDAIATASSEAGLTKNDEGLEYVKLVHPESGASAEVYLYGGVVTSYKDGEGTEFIAVRPDAKMDGSKPISGGLSHCWPQVCNFINGIVLPSLQLAQIFLLAFSLDLVRSNSTDLPAMSCGRSQNRQIPL